KAGAIGQHQVEHQRVEFVVLQYRIGFLTGFDGVGVEATDPKPHPQAVTKNGIVLDNKHAHQITSTESLPSCDRLKASLRISRPRLAKRSCSEAAPDPTAAAVGHLRATRVRA